MTYLDQRRQFINDGRPEKEKKKYTIPKVSAKRVLKIEEGKKTFEEDKKFYKEIWDASPHVCQECNKKLGKEPLTLFFHHALPKRNFPEFRHTAENIIILCPDCHQQAETDLDKVPGVKKRTEEIRAILEVAKQG